MSKRRLTTASAPDPLKDPEDPQDPWALLHRQHSQDVVDMGWDGMGGHDAVSRKRVSASDKLSS